MKMQTRQWTMRHRVWRMLGCGGAGLLLLAGMAGAQPFKGGLPACRAALNTCDADLGTCEADLAVCQAASNAAFPGDGAGHGVALSYTNNMDGTATDNITLLMWEVKDNSGGVHDVDNNYTWSSSGIAADGTLFTGFLNALNNTCEGAGMTDCTAMGDAACGAGVCGLAGHRDWRIPHIKELQSIVDYGVASPGPTIDSTFPGQTAASNDWSSTEDAGDPTFAWFVNFNFGNVNLASKDFALRGRAVRGGP